MSADPTALKVTSLFAGYGRYDVIRDINVTVGEGEAVALIGPNGAGKSTLLWAIMGMLRHRRGSVRVGQREMIRLPTHRIGSGLAALVPEGRRLFLDLSIEDNLLLGGLHLRRDKAKIRELLDSVYELFPYLAQHPRRPASALSGGQQQMVAIGRMMMSDPEIMLLDEPSLGLAPVAIDDVAEALLALRARGRSLLVVEQRVDLAVRLCERIYVLTGGQIVAEETFESLDVEGTDLLKAYLG